MRSQAVMRNHLGEKQQWNHLYGSLNIQSISEAIQERYRLLVHVANRYCYLTFPRWLPGKTQYVSRGDN